VHAAPTADGVESVLLPGEREWRNYHRAVDDGIPLPQDVIDKLQEAAEFMSVPMVS
jgi:ureidoglycolate dehydrogenase (NAD+)